MKIRFSVDYDIDPHLDSETIEIEVPYNIFKIFPKLGRRINKKLSEFISNLQKDLKELKELLEV